LRRSFQVSGETVLQWKWRR